MDFRNQRLVVARRDQGWKWDDIRSVVRTLQKEKPSERQCRDVYKGFNKRLGRKKYNYKNCGRRPWKVTPAVRSYLVKRLRALRTKCICTASTLQRELKKEMDLTLDTSTICKILKAKGYRWLPRSQKPKYSKQDREA